MTPDATPAWFDDGWLLASLVWLILPWPGFVALRRFDDGCLRQGLPAAYAWSALATLILLTPVSIACYLLETSVMVPALWWIALAIAATFFAIRDQIWRSWRPALAGVLGVELLVLIDAWFAFRHGTHFGGDTSVHLARIRFLVDHGMTNRDPFCAVEYFWPIYHTNIMHTLHAGISAATRTDPFLVWFSSLVWSRIMIVCAVYTLAWSIFRRGWVAWSAALFMLAVNAHSALLTYPNKLAPFVIVPLLLALGVRALRERDRWTATMLIAATAVVLGEVHGMYVAFALAFIVPTLLIGTAWASVRQRAVAWKPLAAACAIAIGSPFPLISRQVVADAREQRSAAVESNDDITAQGEDDSAANDVPEVVGGRGPHVLTLANGMRVRNPHRGFTAQSRRPIVLILAAIVVLVALRQRRAAIIILPTLFMSMMLFIPPLCTLAMRILGEEWVLLRAQFLYPIAIACLVPTALVITAAAAGRTVPPLRRVFEGEAQHVALRFGALLAGLVGVLLGFAYDNTWTRYREEFIAKAMEPLDDRMRAYRERRILNEHIMSLVPPGETLLCPLESSALVCSLADVFVVASRSSSLGVPDLPQRRRDLATMLDVDTPWPERRRLLESYDVRYVLLEGNTIQWANTRASNAVYRRVDGRDIPLVAELRLDGDRPDDVRND